MCRVENQKASPVLLIPATPLNQVKLLCADETLVSLIDWGEQSLAHCWEDEDNDRARVVCECGCLPCQETYQAREEVCYLFCHRQYKTISAQPPDS